VVVDPSRRVRGPSDELDDDRWCVNDDWTVWDGPTTKEGELS
jgi:hypothetical protein